MYTYCCAFFVPDCVTYEYPHELSVGDSFASTYGSSQRFAYQLTIHGAFSDSFECPKLRSDIIAI